ncbi:hypothetical protein HON22_00295 [Candidatus Peregrinibacteria bacterium]|jgi:hypothetical protein|nr:hypothetical protein [Candidatus Peregrinibacteria bacterium]
MRDTFKKDLQKSKDPMEKLRDLKKVPSFFVLEEREREQKLKEELLKKENSKRSVLERIQSQAVLLKETSFVDYKDPVILKKELNQSLREVKQKKGEKEESKVFVNRGGRPKIEEKLKAKDLRISLKAYLYEEIEERKLLEKSRSAALCKLLDKGLKYERLRIAQANSLKVHLKEFAEIFSTIKINNDSSLWRNSQILLEKNELALGKLYKKSLEIKKFIIVGEIDPGSFEGVLEYLTDQEIKHLEFASNPSRMANIVKTEEEVNNQQNREEFS